MGEEEKYDDEPKEDKPQDDDAKNEEKDDGKTKMLYRIYDRDSDVPKKVHNKNNERLSKVDKDWKYNITLGDLEFREITHYDNKKEELWFPMEEYPDDYNQDASADKKYDDKKKDDKKKKDKKKKKKETPPRKVFVALKVKRVSAVDNIAETFR